MEFGALEIGYIKHFKVSIEVIFICKTFHAKSETSYEIVIDVFVVLITDL